MARKAKKSDVRIEYPSRGATYFRNEYGVYEYGVYPRGSVLAGQESRTFLASYATLAEAQANHPGASFEGSASGYQAPSLSHLPDDGDY